MGRERLFTSSSQSREEPVEERREAMETASEREVDRSSEVRQVGVSSAPITC